MHVRILLIMLILLSIVPVASASSLSCDTSGAALAGDPAKTAVSGEGNIIVAGSTGGVIGAFSHLGSSRWVYNISGPVSGIALSRDGRFISAISSSGDLYYFNENGSLLWNRSGFGCDSQVALSGDGREGYVFSRSPGHDLGGDTVFRFNDTGSIRSHMPVPLTPGSAVSPDAPMAVVGSGGSSGSNYVVAIDDAGIQWEKPIPGRFGITGVAVSDDSGTIAAIEPGSLTVFSRSGKTLWNTSTKFLLKSVVVSGDGQHIIAGTQYRILSFDRAGILLWEYPLRDYGTHIRSSKDGTRIAATTPETLYYLDGNGSSLWQYALLDRPESLSMSGTGDLIVVGSYNNTLTILDSTGKSVEIKMDSLSTMPVMTTMSGSPVEPSVTPARTPSAAISLFPAMIALVCAGLFLKKRNR